MYENPFNSVGPLTHQTGWGNITYSPSEMAKAQLMSSIAQGGLGGMLGDGGGGLSYQQAYNLLSREDRGWGNDNEVKRQAKTLAYLKRMGGGGTAGSGALGSPTGFAQSEFEKWNNAAGPQYTAPTNAQNRFEAGLSGAESRLQALLDDPESIQQTASYKFRLGQGQEALSRQQAAKGMLGSGNRLMELTKYGQDMASQEYENQYRRAADLTGMYAGNWNTAQSANLQNAANIYGTQMQAHSQRGQTLGSLLGNLYGTDVNAATQKYTAKVGLLGNLLGSALR